MICVKHCTAIVQHQYLLSPSHISVWSNTSCVFIQTHTVPLTPNPTLFTGKNCTAVGTAPVSSTGKSNERNLLNFSTTVL